jgi:unsaturated rhamnogalacturonyl hydrolase
MYTIYQAWRAKKMKMSTMVSPLRMPARRGFFLFITVCLLLAGSSVYAEPNLYNNEDFAGFAEEWQQSCSPGNGWCNGYDYDISGTVDTEDFERFCNLWLTSKDPVLSDDIAAWILHAGVSTAKWNYDAGFILLSLYEKWLAKPNPLYLKLIKDWVDTLVQADGTIQPSYYDKTKYILDHIQPGNLLLILYEHFGTAKYKLAMDNNLIYQLTYLPKVTFDGGFWHKKSYPYQMWLDGLYMAQPFACGYAKMFNEPSFYDIAGYQCTLIATHTQHSQIYGSGTGLLYHGWDSSALETPPLTPKGWAHPTYYHSPEYWGRAIGWYAMALVDCLDIMPADDPCRPQMLTILSDLAEALDTYQDATTGLWYQVVDKAGYSGNYTETSCSAMFSYALARAVEQGYLPEVPYLAISRTAFEGLVANKLSYVGGYISLKDTVSVGSLSGYNTYSGGYAYYVGVDHSGLNDYKGVGAFMRAALQYEKMTPPE